jgi:hypothetical protein
MPASKVRAKGNQMALDVGTQRDFIALCVDMLKQARVITLSIVRKPAFRDDLMGTNIRNTLKCKKGIPMPENSLGCVIVFQYRLSGCQLSDGPKDLIIELLLVVPVEFR